MAKQCRVLVLDRHENGVTGAVLVALGILIFCMEM